MAGYDDNLFVGLHHHSFAKCLICHGVVNNPVSICEEGHPACRNCMIQHVQSDYFEFQKRCPMTCSVNYVSFVRNYPLRNIVEESQVRCSSSLVHSTSEICTWTGQLRTLAAHEHSCGHVLVPCRRSGCTHHCTRLLMPVHESGCQYPAVDIKFQIVNQTGVGQFFLLPSTYPLFKAFEYYNKRRNPTSNFAQFIYNNSWVTPQDTPESLGMRNEDIIFVFG